MIRGAIVVLAVTLLAGSVRADDLTAEQHYQNGQDAYHAGRYKEAISEWEASYALSREPDLLFDLGQAARLDEDCALALRYYGEYVRQPSPGDHTQQAVDFVIEMQRCVDMKLTAKALAEVKPAQPKLVTPAPPTHPGRGKRVTGVLLGVGGGVLIAAGVGLGVAAARAADQVRDACAVSCDWSVESARDAEGRRDEKLSWAFYGVGAAAAIAGGVVYWLGWRDEDAAPRMMVAPAGGGVSAVASWRF